MKVKEIYKSLVYKRTRNIKWNGGCSYRLVMGILCYKFYKSTIKTSLRE